MNVPPIATLWSTIHSNTRAAVITLLAASTLLAGLPLVAQAKTPKHDPFAQYPAGAMYAGRSAGVDRSSSKDAVTFRTRLREAVRNSKGPDFAGHWLVAMWGCGASCQQIALIDMRNGKVQLVPEAGAAGALYRKDSRLLIVNPSAEIAKARAALPPGVHPSYYAVGADGVLVHLAAP